MWYTRAPCGHMKVMLAGSNDPFNSYLYLEEDLLLRICPSVDDEYYFISVLFFISISSISRIVLELRINVHF